MLESFVKSRKLLAPGKGDVPEYKNGTKVTFHFKTVAIFDGKDQQQQQQKTTDDHNHNNDHHHHHHEHKDTVVDDSKESGKPMELFIGKQFKLPLWEEWIKDMRVGERSQIDFEWRFCGDVYPMLSKSYRNFCKPSLEAEYETEETRRKRQSSHCCGGMQSQRSYGYDDLDHLVGHPPTRLQFTLELLTVEPPEKVDKEVWLMGEAEMVKEVPALKAEGNRLFSGKQYEQAAYRYRKALAILEQLMQREKPNDTEWLEYDRRKVPLLLNLAQAELLLGEFYHALEHAGEVVGKEPANVKALFRRGRANAAVWNEEEARRDFAAVAALDPSLGPLVKAELAELEAKLKAREAKESQLLKGKLFSSS
ncbi:PREDICTED: AH receptor-interacting protein-like [Rhagoletis zephyria]|uniref:AH receptor-interacting protein-like n=1 Tax=Rhagoletis zephyria TaxID=28612 RepID=UPI0008114348|nr:PREDICTED: AH receptor-interacting protein-like [Rhagoletis zephyria]